MEPGLTPKQKQILDWIEAYLQSHQTMPSRREIAAGLGLSSPATIQQHIEALEKKGYLKRGETRESRALHWTTRSRRFFSKGSESNDEETLPLLGTIAAGYPIEVFADPKTMRVPRSLFQNRKGVKTDDLFILNVRGDSMIEDGIFPDDWVILQRANRAKPGDRVAALLNGEATLKELGKTPEGLELRPANPKYPTIPIRNEDRFEIQGILIGLIRRYS